MSSNPTRLPMMRALPSIRNTFGRLSRSRTLLENVLPPSFAVASSMPTPAENALSEFCVCVG